MIELGSVSEIVSGFNVARLPINERDRRYTNADFEYDFYRMKLADPSNSIIYRQLRCFITVLWKWMVRSTG